MSEEETEVLEAPVPAAPHERMPWKQKAQQLYESRQVMREQTQKMMLDKRIDQFRDGLNRLLNKDYEVSDLRVELEGVTFLAIGATTPGVPLEIHVEFPCKACGGLQHQYVRGLADIGAIMAGAGDPHENCPALARSDADVELTPAEKLIEAIRDFMASELEQVD
jgi:hypothetical protein